MNERNAPSDLPPDGEVPPSIQAGSCVPSRSVAERVEALDAELERDRDGYK